jgi:hypothetical protein
MSAAKLTPERAREMGRMREPLRMRALGRTLALSQSLTGDGVTVVVETGRKGRTRTVASTSLPKPMRVEVGPATLYSRGTWYELAEGEPDLARAWLAGFYGDGGAA